MSDHEYTPTTKRVRYCATREDARLSFQPESFDRWLTAHDAESERKITEYAAVIKEIRKAWFGPCKFDEQDEEKISEILNRIAVTPD